MVVHAVKYFRQRLVCPNIANGVEETIHSIERSTAHFKLRHVPQLKLNARRLLSRLLLRASQHTFRVVSRDDLVAARFEFEGVRAGAAGDLQQASSWPNRVLRQTLIHERSFGRIRFLSIKEVVKLGVSA